MTELILREWDGKRIRIREDRHVCLTDIAKASKKDFKAWYRTDSAKSYLATLSRLVNIDTDLLIQKITTGKNSDRGTWGHPKVALRFSQWCSDELAIQVDFWIDELLTTGTVSITPQEKNIFTIEMAIRRDPATWEILFTRDWIVEAERLTGWKWTWRVMSGFIVSTVYDYLPHDVVNLLRQLNPKDESGNRAFKHHQFLQPDIRKIVVDHLDTVEDLMKAAKGNLSLFEMLMANRFGRYKLIGSDSDQLTLFEVQTKYLPKSGA